VAHKAAHYAAYLCDLSPDVVEVVLDLLLSGVLPPLEGSLDTWWQEIIKARRQEVKCLLLDEFGPGCECCEVAVGTDLHEVFVRRNDDTSWRQIFSFSRENCALVCSECHQSGAADEDGFKEKIKKRRGFDENSGHNYG